VPKDGKVPVLKEALLPAVISNTALTTSALVATPPLKVGNAP